MVLAMEKSKFKYQLIMKKIFLILTIIGLFQNCKSQNNTKQQYKLTTMFETFDFEKFENDNKEFKENSDTYIFKDKGKIMLLGSELFSLPPKKFYIIYKEFYDNGHIKQKGKYFGDYNLGSYSIKIGKWQSFNEKGKIIEEIDEDRKFGKFDYSEVIKFLDKQKDVNIITGEGREELSIEFYNSDKSDKKLWKVVVNIGKPYGVANLPEDKGMRYAQNAKSYYLDGNTGEIVKGKQLLNYKDIIQNFDKEFPMLIN